MEELGNHYKIFDFAIRSNILLPELTNSTLPNSSLSFFLSPIPSSQIQEPIWLHHWLLPNGGKSISFARSGDIFFLRFPHLADFIFSKIESRIICHQIQDTPKETIRHLLLDQVVPRIVSYLGRPVVHASGSIINNSGILFLGQTGWGKSTLCAHFHQNGSPLLSDDAILLEKTNESIVGVPSYAGIRLIQDSFKTLHLDRNENHNTLEVAHYSSKRRIIFKENMPKQQLAIPIKALFILNNPETTSIKSALTFSPVTGYQAAIELTKHCFQLDPTDNLMMGKQLKTVADFCVSDNLSIYNINFRRDLRLLPDIYREVVSFVTSLT